MKRGGRILLLTSTAALIFGSCGGSDSTPSGSESSEQISVEQMQDLAGSGVVDDIAEASGVPEACVELSLAMASATGGMIPGADNTAVDTESLQRSFDFIKAAAPDDLIGDIDIVKAGMLNYLSILAEYGYDFTALMTDPQALERFSSVFDNDAFAGASERFSTWLDSVCNP
jgi:hypothetical protein